MWVGGDSYMAGNPFPLWKGPQRDVDRDERPPESTEVRERLQEVVRKFERREEQEREASRGTPHDIGRCMRVLLS